MITDTQVLEAVDRVRAMIDDLRRVDPSIDGTKVYLKMYDDLQSTYADALTAARRRGLQVAHWDGDGLVFSPLVDKWVRVDDFR